MTEQTTTNAPQETFLQKIWAWIKRNWLLLLILPTALFVLWKIGQFVNRRWFGGPAGGLAGGSPAKLLEKAAEASNAERRALDEIERRKDQAQDGVDKGDPTPAQVFNEQLGRKP